MKIRTAVLATAATAATAGAVAIGGPAIAAAEETADTGAHALGTQATLANGDVVQGWTVSDLRQSSDAIDYPVHGALWEATATDEALQGSVTPIVANLNARTPGGESYRVMYQVATPQGVNPATLTQGEKTTGKVYFDVTGDVPNSVVYNANGKDLATWVQSAPSSSASANSPATATPLTNQETPAGTPAAPPPAGSQGTPITEGSQGTPLPTGTGETPAGTPATPAPEGTPPEPGDAPETPGAGSVAGTPPAGGAETPTN